MPVTGFLLGLLLAMPGTGVSVLGRGEFHGSEVSAEDGEIWLGLFVHGREQWLAPVELRVMPVFDGIMDDPGQTTCRRVYCDCGEPLLFLRSSGPVFIQGPLAPLVAKPLQMYPGDSIGFHSGQGFAAKEEGLYLVRGTASQLLAVPYPRNDNEGRRLQIAWAGDLDGDGMMDVILNHRFHYNVYINYRVFLSSLAKPGDLVREAASFIAVGC